MTLEQFGNLGEAIGGIAVVISLLALAIQLRQNTKAVRAESARAAESEWATMNIEWANHFPRELGVQVFTATNLDELTPQEALQCQTLFRAMWHQLTSEYYLWRKGLHDEEIWERRVVFFRGFIEPPLVRHFFEEERRTYLDPNLYREIMDARVPDAH
ncbi:MAG: hypothetical protein ABJK25_00045 [Halieaceae bacterium]